MPFFFILLCRDNVRMGSAQRKLANKLSMIGSAEFAKMYYS